MKAKSLIIIFIWAAIISYIALNMMLRHTTKTIFVQDSDFKSKYNVHVPDANKDIFKKIRRSEPNRIDVDWGETNIYLNGLCRVKICENHQNLIVMGELPNGKSYPVIIDSGFAQYMGVTDTVVADAKLEIQPVEGLGNNTGGFCFIPQLKIGNLTIVSSPCVYWLGHYERHVFGIPIWKEKKIYLGLNLLRQFKHITIDYIAKEVEFSGKGTFNPDNPNEWFQCPFKIEMNSNKQAKLILDISVAGQLPSIPLDTGAGPGLILTEKLWSKISSGLHLLQEEKSKLATPYGYLPCKKITVKELKVGDMLIRDANVYVVPNDNPRGEDDHTLGMGFFKETITVLDFDKNLMWVKKEITD